VAGDKKFQQPHWFILKLNIEINTWNLAPKMNTPKALANFSPGLLQPWDKEVKESIKRGKRWACPRQTPSEFDRNDGPF
jgi:hypothetical protein